MADATILAAGSATVPAGYTVPPTQQIQPKAVRAVLDGTGASGSYLAVLQVVSDSGIVIAEGVCTTTIAAGASAQVSWFPHVGGASGSTGATGETGIYNVNSTAVAAGVAAFMPLAFVTGTAVVDLTAPTTPAITTAGIYVVAASMTTLTNATTNNYFEMDLSFTVPSASNTHMEQTVYSPFLTHNPIAEAAWAVAFAAGDTFRLKIWNRDSVSRNFLSDNVIVTRIT